ncbi:MAG: PLP-dependent aminotransferase family protein [Gaiellales bacterium]
MPTQIPFTRGVPSADLLPVEDIRRAAAAALQDDAVAALSYAPSGHRRLREWIAARHGVTAERVLMVNGSLEGLGFLARHLLAGRPTAAVVEDPTYDRTLKVLRAAGAEVRAVPLEADGIDVDALREALDADPAPTLAYLVPTFQNPAGISLSAEKRRAVVELARDRGVLLVEDDPYGLLRFEGEHLPSLHELDGGGNVVYSCSFTKTVAPGVRTGYLVLPDEHVPALSTLSTNTYISPNAFAEATLAAYCAMGCFEPNVARATAELRRRRDAMEAALREHFPAGSSWTTPQGGYFFWVELPKHIDPGAALAAATEAGVPYVSGRDFSDSEVGRHSLRLAFSAVPPDQIGEGIARLAEVLAKAGAPAGVTG